MGTGGKKKTNANKNGRYVIIISDVSSSALGFDFHCSKHLIVTRFIIYITAIKRTTTSQIVAELFYLIKPVIKYIIIPVLLVPMRGIDKCSRDFCVYIIPIRFEVRIIKSIYSNYNTFSTDSSLFS